MIILRRRQSTKQSGDLYCQNQVRVGNRLIPCLSKRLKFLSSEGPVDIYKCKDCGCTLRYHTVPLDPKGDMDKLRAEKFSGIHQSQMRLPNIGPYKVSKKLI